MKKVIYTKNAPEPVGPYSQAIQHYSFLYLSGQIGINPDTNKMVTGGVEAETRQVIENIKSVLTAAGSSLGSVIKATCFLKDMKDFSKYNEIYSEYFHESKPARSTIQVAALPLGALIEIEVVAIAE